MSSTVLSLRLQPTTVPPGPGRPPRPRLRVLEGGRAPSRLARQATYRRRRLVVAGVAVLVLWLLLPLANAALAGIAGGASGSAAGALSPASGQPATVVVGRGDTLWSIAATVAPDVDVRITVERLRERNGRSPLVVGQVLELP